MHYLTKLRAHRVGAVAEEDDAASMEAPQRTVTVAREGDLSPTQ